MATGCSLIDTDTAIEERTGRTIPEIFATEGESGFRQIEEQVVRRCATTTASCRWEAAPSPSPRAGGAGRPHRGLPGDQCLRGRPAHQRRHGPTLLAGPDRAEKYRELISARVPLYRQAATIRINTNRRKPGAVVRYIAGRLENPQPPDGVARRGGARARLPRPPADTSRRRRGWTFRPESGPVTPATLARRAGLRK